MKTREKSQPGTAVLKKKGHGRAKSSLIDSAQKQLQSKTPQSSEKTTAPGPHNSEENDKALSMRPDEDDGTKSIEPSSSKPVEKENVKKHKEAEFYPGNDTHRNLHNTPTKAEGKLFERFFKDDGGVRRSMSLEDLNIGNKVFNRNHNKSTMHNPEGTNPNFIYSHVSIFITYSPLM